jgi:ParB-like chromosome segregation protein Spo0J
MDTSPSRRATARGRARSKIGLVSFLDRPVDSIRPSPANDKLYRPVSPDDPEIVALARSIQAHGLLQPLIITQDDFILSGHRRHMACRLADRVLDVGAFNAEIDEEKRDAAKLDGIRRALRDSLGSFLGNPQDTESP